MATSLSSNWRVLSQQLIFIICLVSAILSFDAVCVGSPVINYVIYNIVHKKCYEQPRKAMKQGRSSIPVTILVDIQFLLQS